MHWRVFFFSLALLGNFFVVVPVCLISIFRVDWIINPKKNVTDRQKRMLRITALFALLVMGVQAGEILYLFLYLH